MEILISVVMGALIGWWLRHRRWQQEVTQVRRQHLRDSVGGLTAVDRQQLAGVDDGEPDPLTDDAAAELPAPEIELRRLRSECLSLQHERDAALKQVELLQARLGEQESGTFKAATATPVVSTEGATAGASTPATAAPALTPLFDAPDGEHDDLKKITGIGPKMERLLNQLGITTFRQLANFTTDDVQRVSQAMSVFPGRIERDDWIGGARAQLEARGQEV